MLSHRLKPGTGISSPFKVRAHSSTRHSRPQICFQHPPTHLGPLALDGTAGQPSHSWALLCAFAQAVPSTWIALPYLTPRHSLRLGQQHLLQEGFLGPRLGFHRALGFPTVVISFPGRFLSWPMTF